MSTYSHFFDLQEQICYLQCGFCTTILLVSVPNSSLSMTVAVKCGHCSGLLSVNMMKASFVPLSFLASLSQFDQTVQHKEESSVDESQANATKTPHNKLIPSTGISSETEDDDDISISTKVINKPPEKRQRAPSAYNYFIKEEINRLKQEDPTMSHKVAFSTAAKNWAHLPMMRHKGIEEKSDQADQRDM